MSQFTILGGSGYVGRNLVQRLKDDGHNVFAPLRGDSTIFDRPLGHVIYCIGLTANFRARPFDTVQAHVSLLADVLQRAQFESLLYLSSTRVYLGSDRTDEDAPLIVNPRDPSQLYNLTKLTGESLCHASGHSHVRVARLSNVVGPSMDAASGNLIALLLHDARMGHIVLESALDSVKDYIHINDVLDWLPRIALNGEATTYNVASGIQVTHADWIQWLIKHTGCTYISKPDAPIQYFLPINIQRLQVEFCKNVRHLPDCFID